MKLFLQIGPDTLATRKFKTKVEAYRSLARVVKQYEKLYKGEKNMGQYYANCRIKYMKRIYCLAEIEAVLREKSILTPNELFKMYEVK